MTRFSPGLAHPSFDDPSGAPNASGEPRGGATRDRQRVLIVDDDQGAREMYAWCLRASYWIVEEAANGEEALFVAATFDPDVIVMDPRMPGLDRLKSDFHTRHIPIVASVPALHPRAEMRAKDEDRHEGVPKRYPPEALRDLLQHIIDRRPTR